MRRCSIACAAAAVPNMSRDRQRRGLRPRSHGIFARSATSACNGTDCVAQTAHFWDTIACEFRPLKRLPLLKFKDYAQLAGCHIAVLTTAHRVSSRKRSILERCSYEEVEQASDSRNLRRLRDQLVLLRRLLMNRASFALPILMRAVVDPFKGRRRCAS
jgi:hypothetical protein